MSERENILKDIARKIEPIAWCALGVGDTRKHWERRTTSMCKADQILSMLEDAGLLAPPAIKQAEDGK